MRVDRFALGNEGGIQLLHASPHRYYLGTFGDEHREDFDRLLQDAAAVPPQVDNQSFDPRFFHRHDSVADIVAAIFGKIFVYDVTDAVVDNAPIRNARHDDPFPLEGQFFFLAGQQFANLQVQRGARRGFQHRTHLAHFVAFDAFSVHFEQEVAHHESGLVGRRVFIRLGDHHVVVLLPDHRAHAAVLAGGHDLEIGHLLFGNQFGVRIELGGHAVGCVQQHFVGIDLVHVEQVQFAEHVEQYLDITAQREIRVRCRDRYRTDQSDQCGEQRIFDAFFRFRFHVNSS